MIIENYKKKFNIENQQQQHHRIRKRKRQNSPMSTEIVSNIDQQNELQYVKSSGEIRDAKQRRPAQETWVSAHAKVFLFLYIVGRSSADRCSAPWLLLRAAQPVVTNDGVRGVIRDD